MSNILLKAPALIFPVGMLVLGLGMALPQWAHAEDRPKVTVAIHNHRFEPAEVKVPAGQKFILIVENQDSTAEEFESHELNREKVVTGNNHIRIYLGPLDAGSYPFFGDFHPDTAQGKLFAQ